MSQSEPGEVWLVDLGLTAKVRPAVILSDYPSEDELALVLIAPHTTSTLWPFDGPTQNNEPRRGVSEPAKKAVAILRNRRHIGCGSAVSERRLHAVEG